MSAFSGTTQPDTRNVCPSVASGSLNDVTVRLFWITISRLNIVASLVSEESQRSAIQVGDTDLHSRRNADGKADSGARLLRERDRNRDHTRYVSGSEFLFGSIFVAAQFIESESLRGYLRRSLE